MAVTPAAPDVSSAPDDPQAVDYRALFEAAPGPFLVLTADTLRIVAVSDTYLETTGRRRDELLGQGLFDAFPDDPAEPDADGTRNLLASLERVKATGERDVMAVQRYPIADGHGGFEERFWSPVNVPVRDAAGHLRWVVHRVDDVTGRHRAEETLVRVQDQLMATLHGMSDAFYLLDRDWRFVFINPQAEKLLRQPRAELLGRVLWEAFPEAAACADFQAYRDAMQDGVTRRLEVRYAPLDDWFEISAQPSPRGLGVYFRQVTARKQLTAQLTASEERFRYVTQAIADAAWDWDLEADTIWWSGGFSTLFGYRAEEIDPDAVFWAGRIHPDDEARVLDGIHAVIDGDGIQWRDEYRFRRRDGSYAIVQDRGFVIRDDAGRPRRMVGGMSDVTELRALEAQLRASQRLEAVGQLTGGLAHDFNNLLTVVLGNAELLEERLPARSVEQELSGMILSAARRGAELTQRLLAFARRQALALQPVELGALVRGMQRLLRGALGAQVVLELPPSDVRAWAMADAAQLENALLNLALNARDAMPGEGRLRVALSIRECCPPDIDPLARATHATWACLEIADTGGGIEPEILPKVIEPFFTTRTTGKGTGLGLSMVYGLIKQSSGFMDIVSRPGEGTCVRIHLPAIAPPEDAGQPTVAPHAADGGDAHVLLVEDDALVRRYALTQLEALGCRVSLAGDAEGALHLLRSDASIRLMLTDVRMPGLNGSQLAQAARAIRPDLRVLFSSGYSEDALVLEGQLPPGVLLLAKPYTRAELAARLRQALA